MSSVPVDSAQLAALAQQNKVCQACELRRGCTQVVVSDGNPEAKLVIIGEGPGGDEDRIGKPFVGRGGQLLDKILGAVSLSRDEVYVTNIVKCRPPSNRTPLPLESETCTSLWLEPQLALLRPRVIVSLGNTPTQYLLQIRQGITKLRGVWHSYQQRESLYSAYLMPMFHPAYLLRNDTRAVGGPKSLTWQDIKEVRAVLDGKTPQGLGDLKAEAGQETLF